MQGQEIILTDDLDTSLKPYVQALGIDTKSSNWLSSKFWALEVVRPAIRTTDLWPRTDIDYTLRIEVGMLKIPCYFPAQLQDKCFVHHPQYCERVPLAVGDRVRIKSTQKNLSDGGPESRSEGGIILLS